MLESDIQIQLVEYLRWSLHKDILFFSIPNEAMGRAKSAGGIARMTRLKKMGLRSGVADLLFVKSGQVFFLEMKKKTGKQTESQLQFEADVIRSGAQYSVAYGFDEAISALRAWGILGGR